MSEINLNIFNNLSSYEEYIIKCDLIGIKPNDERLLESKLFRKLDDENYYIIIDGKAIVINKLTGKFEDNCFISKINSYAFFGCSNLTTVSFPVCTSIGEDAFRNCYKLTTANFPVCTSIGSYAFCGCSNLKEITVKNGCKIGKYAILEGCIIKFV